MYTTKVDELPSELIALWTALHERKHLELGPLLHPGYVRAVSAVRSDVEVGVLETDGDVQGFFPFQRSSLGVARSVGGRLCGQSGAVLRPDATWSPRAFARAVGLRAIRLRNSSTADEVLRPFQGPSASAPYMDLSRGFDAYREESLAESSLLRQVERRSRKAERDIGPIRFEWQATDPSVFQTLLDWKAAQRRETRSPNVLDLPWARTLAERLRDQRDPCFGGVLSALWFGDTLAAAQLSIRSRRVLHYLIPAYNVELARFSPGIVCLVHVAHACACAEGIERIELGIGDARFKERSCNGEKRLAVATVTVGPAAGAAFRTADRVRAWSRASRVGNAVRATRRAVMRGSYVARGLLFG